MLDKIKCVIVGATGYGGAELLRNLLFHPFVDVTRITAVDYVGKPISDVHMSLLGKTSLKVEQLDVLDAAQGADVVFFALPHKVSAKEIMRLFGTGVKIIDLSGDFRLQNKDDYTQFYGPGHPCHEASATFVYGLPELFRRSIRTATRIASPGCFATAITLSMLPLAKAGLLSGPARVAAMTGSSGSGAEPKLTTHHPLRAGNIRAYKTLDHQHTPEIIQTLQAGGAGADFSLQFVPISAPLVRGIFVTAFVEVPAHLNEQDIRQIYRSEYGDEPCIRLLEGRLPEVIGIAGSMFVEIGLQLDTEARDGKRTLVCFSALDNLVKGGAGQAIQSMNILMGWPELTGVDRVGLWP